jgi:phage protein D
MPAFLVQSIKEIEVRHNDEQRSGFQISFWVGRAGAANLLDYPALSSNLLQPFNRVILIVTIGTIPQVLFDGFITHQQLMSDNTPGMTTLVITGEDVSIMMDLTEQKIGYPALKDTDVVPLIIARYGQYKLLPMITTPASASRPPPGQKIFQSGTDLAYLSYLAARYDYVFYIIPGPLAGTSRAYWGPRIRPGKQQPPLSVNLGTITNVESIQFQYNALSPVKVKGFVQDSKTNQIKKVAVTKSSEFALSKNPALKTQPKVREQWLRGASGMTYTEAVALAQGIVDAANDNVVVAEGRLDTLQYGQPLSVRQLVGLRGAGTTYDGLYYVKSVRHSMRVGAYTQSFTLIRQGTTTNVPRVGR